MRPHRAVGPRPRLRCRSFRTTRTSGTRTTSAASAMSTARLARSMVSTSGRTSATAEKPSATIAPAAIAGPPKLQCGSTSGTRPPRPRPAPPSTRSARPVRNDRASPVSCQLMMPVTPPSTASTIAAAISAASSGVDVPASASGAHCAIAASPTSRTAVIAHARPIRISAGRERRSAPRKAPSGVALRVRPRAASATFTACVPLPEPRWADAQRSMKCVTRHLYGSGGPFSVPESRGSSNLAMAPASPCRTLSMVPIDGTEKGARQCFR